MGQEMTNQIGLSVEDIKGCLVTFRKRPSPSCVYLVRNVDSGMYKIGISSKVDARVATLSRQCGSKLEIVKVVPSHDTRACEGLLHDIFAHRRCAGEWFALSRTDVRGALKVMAVADAAVAGSASKLALRHDSGRDSQAIRSRKKKDDPTA